VTKNPARHTGRHIALEDMQLGAQIVVFMTLTIASVGVFI